MRMPRGLDGKEEWEPFDEVLSGVKCPGPMASS